MPGINVEQSSQFFGRLKSAFGSSPKSYAAKGNESINVGPQQDIVQTSSKKTSSKNQNRSIFKKILNKFSQQFKKQDVSNRPVNIQNASNPNVPQPPGKMPTGNVHATSHPDQNTAVKDELPHYKNHANDPIVEFSHSHPIQHPDGTIGHSEPVAYVYNQYQGHYLQNRDKIFTAQSKEDWADRFGGAKAAQETQYKNLDDIQMGEAMSRSMHSKYDHNMSSNFAHGDITSDITPVSYSRPQSFIGTDRETGRAIYSDSMPAGQMNTYKQTGVDHTVPVQNGFFVHGDDVHAPPQHSNNSSSHEAKDPFDDDYASSISSRGSSRYASSSNESYAESVFDKPFSNNPQEESFEAFPLPPESVKSFKTAGNDTYIPHKAGYSVSNYSADRTSFSSATSSHSENNRSASIHGTAKPVDARQAELDQKVFSFDEEIKNSPAYRRAGLDSSNQSETSSKQQHFYPADDISSLSSRSYQSANDSDSWISRD